MTTLAPKEAMRALADGKKIRNIEWAPNMHLSLISGHICTEGGHGYAITNFNNFELYQEPKQKVRMWKWAFQYKSSGKVSDTSNYFRNQEEVEEMFKKSNIRILQKIETSMIEVEE